MEEEKKKGRCFIATAVYGSYSAPDVILLRRFRDQVLLKYAIGRCFVSVYYWISPSIANFMCTREPLKKWVKLILIDFLVMYVKKVVR